MQVNFGLFKSHQLKPCFESKMGCLIVYDVFEPSKTYVSYIKGHGQPQKSPKFQLLRILI